MWIPPVSLSPEDQLAEFDRWVTPSLGDVRDTDRFAFELDSMHAVVTDFARSLDSGRAPRESVADLTAAAFNLSTAAARSAALAAIAALLFLVTAKSDNAVKCQFPIAYRVIAPAYPILRSGQLVYQVAPSVIKSVDVIRNALRVASVDQSVASALVSEYFNFILSEQADLDQFVALCESVSALERAQTGAGRHLLAPLVSFQVRGSVAASGGHDPEQIVRDHLKEWGLEPQVQYNLGDVTAGSIAEWLAAQGAMAASTSAVVRAEKTRAFDFVFPHHQVTTAARVFVQSQFYAGDSGSVSHKNVDQAGAARVKAADLFTDARFVELVDGAGYCASLRSDLQHLLFAADTDDWFQLRSIPVRLRRILQGSGIIAPLDVAIRVAEGVSTRQALVSDLASRIPVDQDADLFIDELVGAGWLRQVGDQLTIPQAHQDLVDRFALLDTILASARSGYVGTGVFAPGFGPDFGLDVDPNWNTTVLSELISTGVLISGGQI